MSLERGARMVSVRAVRVEKPAWANVRTALGLVLFCVALVAGQRLISSAQDTTQVWVAARDLPADTVLGSGDLRAEDVRLPSNLAGNYLPADTSVDGRALARPILEGEMVTASAVAVPSGESADQRITLPADALGQSPATLRLGDRVDVLATFDPGDVRSETVPVVRGAEVVEIVTARGVVGASDVAGVTIDVPEELVGKLAFARHNAELDLVKVSGGPTVGGDWSVTREDW